MTRLDLSGLMTEKKRKISALKHGLSGQYGVPERWN